MEKREDKTRFFYPGSLPTKEIYKIGCLNKAFKAKVEEFFAPFKLNDFLKYYDCVKFMDVLSKAPNFDLY